MLFEELLDYVSPAVLIDLVKCDCGTHYRLTRGYRGEILQYISEMDYEIIPLVISVETRYDSRTKDFYSVLELLVEAD